MAVKPGKSRSWRTCAWLALGSISLTWGGCAEDMAAQAPDKVQIHSSADSSAGEDQNMTSATGNDAAQGPQYNKLTPAEARVIVHKGTEMPDIGEYTHTKDPGTYVCRRCNAPLYRSQDKFESDCGWPSFDDEIAGAVKKVREVDGSDRIEIICENCGGHLGHVFVGERFTKKNTRHCGNSVSMKFYPEGKEVPAVIKKDGKK